MDSVLNKLLVLPILGGGVDEDPRDYDKGMKGVVSQLKALPARAIIRGLHKPGDVLVVCLESFDNTHHSREVLTWDRILSLTSNQFHISLHCPLISTQWALPMQFHL